MVTAESIVNITYFIFLLLVIYNVLSLILLFIITNNIKFWHRGSSSFPYPTTSHFLTKPKRAYYIAKNPSEKGWVVLLHYYGGRSQDMGTRGQYYYNKGYSLIFVDGRSHGLSQYSAETHSLVYALDVEKILEKEHIENPILHGVSYGGLACVFLSESIDAHALVLESISSELKKIYWNSLKYILAPKFLFGWIPYLIFWLYRKFDWTAHDLKGFFQKSMYQCI